MLRLFTWPFRMIGRAFVLLVCKLGALLKSVIIFLSVGVFLIAFGIMGYLMFMMFNNAPGKASLYAAEGTLSFVFGLLPWWIVLLLIGATVYLWFCHKIVMSALAGVLAAVLVSVLIIV